MAEDGRLSHQAFLSKATEAGIDVSGSHGEDLFHFVQDVLATLESLEDVGVAGAEPDMAFMPNGASLGVGD